MNQLHTDKYLNIKLNEIDRRNHFFLFLLIRRTQIPHRIQIKFKRETMFFFLRNVEGKWETMIWKKNVLSSGYEGDVKRGFTWLTRIWHLAAKKIFESDYCVYMQLFFVLFLRVHNFNYFWHVQLFFTSTSDILKRLLKYIWEIFDFRVIIQFWIFNHAQVSLEFVSLMHY